LTGVRAASTVSNARREVDVRGRETGDCRVELGSRVPDPVGPEGLDVLIAVSERGAADLSTLAKDVELHPSTTLRMLESLRSRDMVRQRRGNSCPLATSTDQHSEGVVQP
jgi:hypothetical protein